MKKKIMYLIIPMLFFMGMYEVNAEGGATCVYSFTELIKLKCEVTEEKVSCVFFDKSGTAAKYMATNNKSLTQVNFQKDKKWKCMPKIYYNYTQGNASDPTITYHLLSSAEDKNTKSLSLIASESTDGGALSDESPIGDEKSVNCQYGKLIVTYNKDKNTISDNGPCSRTNLHFKAENLTGCPDKLWAYSYQGTCNYYLNQQSVGGWIELNSDDPIPDADGEDKSSTGVSNPKPGEKTEGCAILGGVDSKTVGLLSWAMKIIRLGVPILIIILGMIDFLQILFSGEDKVFKDAFAKFVKRLIIGVCIIFIPYVIQLVIRLSGVDTQYGIDNFFCGIIDATSGVKVESNSYDDPQECVQAGYYWMPEKKSCIASLDKAVKTKDECTANGYQWQQANMEYGGYCYRPMPSTFKNFNDCEKIGYTWHHVASREYGGYCSKK